MGIGDSIIFVFSVVLLVILSLPALLIFLNLALPGISNRAAERLTQGGITPFLVGISTALIMGIPAAILVSLGSIFQLCGSIVSLLLLFWGFMGLAVITRLAGYRITVMGKYDTSYLIQLMAGAMMMSLSIAFPVIGWFVILPLSLLIGLGAISILTIKGIWRWAFGTSSQVTASQL